MRRLLIAVAVTSGVVAATRRSRKPCPAVVPAVIPAPRVRPRLEQLVDDDGGLVVADQNAQDDHILATVVV